MFLGRGSRGKEITNKIKKEMKDNQLITEVETKGGFLELQGFRSLTKILL